MTWYLFAIGAGAAVAAMYNGWRAAAYLKPGVPPWHAYTTAPRPEIYTEEGLRYYRRARSAGYVLGIAMLACVVLGLFGLR